MDVRYFWSQQSDVPIDEWLRKTRPSIITDDDTPVVDLGEGLDKSERRSRKITGARAGNSEGADDPLAERLEEIQEDESIPVRGKKGTKSKKQVREEVQDTARKELEELSKESKWTVGKWLFFPRNPEVDHIWSLVAHSVVDGPLKKVGIDFAKVAPTPRAVVEGEVPVHVICIYMDDVYDKVAVTRVLDTLLREHGLEPSACKSDLYTLAGIDSKHPTGLRSSIWRPSELVEGGGTAIKAIKDEYRSNKKAPGDQNVAVGPDGIIESDSEDERIVKAAKRKPESADAHENTQVQLPVAKKVKSAAVKYKEEDIFAGGDDSD